MGLFAVSERKCFHAATGLEKRGRSNWTYADIEAIENQLEKKSCNRLVMRVQLE